VRDLYDKLTLMEQKDWAVLGKYHWREEALVIRSVLESAGIPCTMMDEQSFSINPATTAMEVHLCVPLDRLSEARALIAAEPELVEERESVKVCGCGSKRWVERPRYGLNFFRFVLGLLVLQPSRAARAQVVCECCGVQAE
jgi:hypothetical protein